MRLKINSLWRILFVALGSCLAGCQILVSAVSQQGENSAKTTRAAPVISTISDQVSSGESIAPITFTISDSDSDVSSLVVTASSDNPTLLPVGSLALGGTGSSRTLSITPASGIAGSGTVTVSVSDGSLTSTETFTLDARVIFVGARIQDLTAALSSPYSTLTLSAPAGAQPGDLLLSYAVYTYDNEYPSVAASVTVPAGWSSLTGSTFYPSSMYSSGWTDARAKIISATTGSEYTFSVDYSNDGGGDWYPNLGSVYAITMAYRGANSSTPIQSSGSGSGTSISATTLSNPMGQVGTRQVLVVSTFSWATVVSTTCPSGYTSRFSGETQAGSGQHFRICDRADLSGSGFSSTTFSTSPGSFAFQNFTKAVVNPD
jgi:hypothetical protein